MRDNSRKLGLTSICVLFLGICIFIGIDLRFNTDPEIDKSSLQGEQPVSLNGVPYKELLGRWQSACNHRHFDRAVIMSIDFRPHYIRWSKQFFLDKQCTINDEIERSEYFITYRDDVQILGAVSAKLFRLKSNAVDESSSTVIKEEIFRAESGWLYVSADGTGPEYSKPWGLDSNFGLRRTDW